LDTNKLFEEWGIDKCMIESLSDEMVEFDIDVIMNLGFSISVFPSSLLFSFYQILFGLYHTMDIKT
jgi:hypothetical protein